MKLNIFDTIELTTITKPNFMKKYIGSVFFALAVFTLVPAFSLAQQGGGTPNPLKVTIEDITGNPGNWAGKFVEIQGTVIQYYPTATGSNTAYYVFESDFGNSINVNSLSQPANRKSYKVRGIVQLSASTRNDAFIVEQSRQVVADSRQNLLIGVLAACVLIIIGVSIFLVIQSRKNRKQRNSYKDFDGNRPDQSRQPNSLNQDFPQANFSPQKETPDFATIKLFTDGGPRTMKFIPGKLDIVSGADKGKSFKIAGYPTPEGDIVTVGRDKVTGDRSFAHIQIDAQFRTVSRQHFKLIFRRPDLLVQNLSGTNPARLNGAELTEGETRKIKSGDIIGAGELEFQYSI
jgi:hypothetical protein